MGKQMRSFPICDGSCELNVQKKFSQTLIQT